MVHYALLSIVCFLSFKVLGQDERYYQQILKPQALGIYGEGEETKLQTYSVDGARYSIDLNGDKLEEWLRPQKRDGVDWLEVLDHNQRTLFEGKLLAMGGASHLYKIRISQINANTKLLMLFLDEGYSRGKKFESTARIYLMTFENNDLTTLSLAEGPHFFHEKEGQREQYWTRDYQVNVKDVDGDGTKEVVVEYNHIQRFMIYRGQGRWERL